MKYISILLMASQYPQSALRGVMITREIHNGTNKQLELMSISVETTLAVAVQHNEDSTLTNGKGPHRSLTRPLVLGNHRPATGAPIPNGQYC